MFSLKKILKKCKNMVLSYLVYDGKQNGNLWLVPSIKLKRCFNTKKKKNENFD